MSLFETLGNNKKPQLPDKTQMNNLANQLRSDPATFLQNMRYNIPAGLDLKNPNTIINFLIQSRQVNGNLLGMAQQLLGMFK